MAMTMAMAMNLIIMVVRFVIMAAFVFVGVYGDSRSMQAVTFRCIDMEVNRLGSQRLDGRLNLREIHTQVGQRTQDHIPARTSDTFKL